MWSKQILSVFSISTLSAVIWICCYGLKMKLAGDLSNDENTLPADRRKLLSGLGLEEFVDPKSVSLRATATATSTVIDLQTDASQQARVSYVTSFWAQESESGSEVHPHRLETKASLLANMHNPHFDQVVVFLDGVKEGANCPLFLDEMVQLSFTLGITSFPTTSINHADLHSKVTCVGSPYGQPNYYQMFQNAVSDYVTGDVVVMANADMAFDDTISLARHLNPEVLVGLGTSGFSDKMPSTVKAIYEQIVGTPSPTHMDENRCAAAKRWSWSWDTWIFYKSKLRGRLQSELFTRQNEDHESEHFSMNELGAENAALVALQQTYPFKSIYNACGKINSWSFHLTPKTHHVRSTPWLKEPGNTEGVKVSRPWKAMNKFPECFRRNNCFLN